MAAGRKEFKEYPFIRFRTHDIEKAPLEDLVGTQHVVITSNAVHATHSLTESNSNIRQFLRSNGLLMMLEITETVYWINMIFGLLEGWWLFNDGRKHPNSHESRWERELHSVGYGHFKWTDGTRPENNLQRIVIALATRPRYDFLPRSPKPTMRQEIDCAARQVAVDDYVRKSTHDFATPLRSDHVTAPSASEHCILITGATGSLGSHLVAHCAGLPKVKSVIYLNRPYSGSEPGVRQREAMRLRGMSLDRNASSKLKVLANNTAKPMLDIPPQEHETLLDTVTQILQCRAYDRQASAERL